MTIPLDPVKSRQRDTWGAGDYASVAAYIHPVAEDLCAAADLQAGWRVLDVATGSGNGAIAAGRCMAKVTGLDLVPALLDRARARVAAEGLPAGAFEFIEGDAENLPFPDGSFDAVLSIFGVMFAPDHQRAAHELARVCRPGGRIALASWTPEGFVGHMFRAVAKAMAGIGTPPPPPIPASPPPLWGTETHLRTLFGGAAASMEHQRCAAIFRYESARHFPAFFRPRFGPMVKAFAALPPEKAAELEAELIALAERFDRNQAPGGPIAITGEYLRTIIVRA